MNQGTRTLIEAEQKLKGKIKCTLGPHCAGFSIQRQRFKQHQLKKSSSKLQCACYSGTEPHPLWLNSPYTTVKIQSFHHRPVATPNPCWSQISAATTAPLPQAQEPDWISC